MIGAIIGDIVGSTREFEYQKDELRNWPLIIDDSQITDDSILTIATAHALMNKKDFSGDYYNFAIKNPQPMGGYGSMFVKWIYDRENRKPYDSFGNGSAMRISPVGWFSNSEEEVLELAKQSAKVTHSHEEGIKGAQAVAWLIYQLRNGMKKSEVKEKIENKFNYDLDFSLIDLHKNYQFEPSCQKTVPQAIFCFLEANSFEEILRNVLFIGGDTDTLGAIAGAIGEAYYEIPPELYQVAIKKIKNKNPDLLTIFNDFNKLKLEQKIKVKGNNKPFIRTLAMGELINIKFKDSDLLVSFVNYGDNNPIDDINKSPIIENINVKNQIVIYANDISYEHLRKPNFINKFLRKNVNEFHFNDQNAIDIISKVSEENIKNVYINCEYGKSRSVTTAIFINETILKNHILLTEDKIIRNKYIYDKLNKILKRLTKNNI